MFPESRVIVLAREPALRHALVARIQSAGLTVAEATDAAELEEGDLVVAPAGECSVGECAWLAGRGVLPIILASFPGHAEHERYLHAGAGAYVAMLADGRPLVAAIRRLLPDHAHRGTK